MQLQKQLKLASPSSVVRLRPIPIDNQTHNHFKSQFFSSGSVFNSTGNDLLQELVLPCNTMDPGVLAFEQRMALDQLCNGPGTFTAHITFDGSYSAGCGGEIRSILSQNIWLLVIASSRFSCGRSVQGQGDKADVEQKYAR